MNVITPARKLRWNEEMKNMVKEQYPLGDKKELAKKLGVSLKAVKHAAKKLGIKSQQDKRFYKLKPLYEDSILSYYWMGFIIADGHITKRGELSIGLSDKDRPHLEKLSQFLNINLRDYVARCPYSGTLRSYCRIACLDTYFGPKIINKFNLSIKPKTSNPPSSLDFSEPKYLLAFMIGFIDGDGSFEKDPKGEVRSIKLEMHSAWKAILENLCIQLAKIDIGNTSVKINKRGYVFMRIHKYKNLRYLRRFALHHKLPILERKWSQVNENKDVDRVKKTDLPLDCNNFHG